MFIPSQTRNTCDGNDRQEVFSRYLSIYFLLGSGLVKTPKSLLSNLNSLTFSLKNLLIHEIEPEKKPIESLFPKLNPMRSMHIPKKVMRWQRLFLKVSLKHFYKAWPWEQKFAALTNLEHTLNFSS